VPSEVAHKSERVKYQLDKAIAALTGVSKQPRHGRPPGLTGSPKKRGRRQLSPAARKKLSRLLKQEVGTGKDAAEEGRLETSLVGGDTLR
jgi:hypothetical protein